MSESVVATITNWSVAASVNPFLALGLDERLIAALTYPTPSPIQRESIPVILANHDVIGLAGTGTGKTAAFALPVVQQLATKRDRRGVAVLILTPTRELAIQVAKAVNKYGEPFSIRVMAVYGGTGFGEQIRGIRNGVDVIVATPGRALDLVRQGKLPLDKVSTVVLDEADEMLDMGFADDIEALLKQTPSERQTLLFSATMPPRIEQIAQQHLRNPIRIAVKREMAAPGEAAKVRQYAYTVRREQKLTALSRILEVEQPTSAIIFCRTRTDADSLTETLTGRSNLIRPVALHGGLTQEQRDRVMGSFRAGTVNLLIATDIAARGLDISHLSHVINFSLPEQIDAYVHRIGRVGRAGREGVVITLLQPREQSYIPSIERATKLKIQLSQVPSVPTVRKARLKKLATTLREQIAQGNENDELKSMLAELQKDHSVETIALAALAILHGPQKIEADDIPQARPETIRPRDGGPHGGPRRDPRGGDRPGGERRPLGPSVASQERQQAGQRPTRPGMAKVYFGIGRDAQVRPSDLVGAIANETGIPGGDIGAIDLTDRFALVEVPQDLADYVVESMQGTRIKGRKVNVRADRPPRVQV